MGRTFTFGLVFCTALLVGSSFVVAQEDEGDQGGSAPEDIDRVTDLMAAEPVMYQVTVPRVWAIVVPSFLLDAFFDMHGNTWDGRANLSYGAEFIIRRVEEFDLVFSLDWADLRTTDDWWKEDGEPVIDADWGENSLSLITADVAIHWMTNLNHYWDLYYGVGLGVAFFLGDFLKTDVAQSCFPASIDEFDETSPSIVRNNCETADGDPLLEPNAEPEEEDRLPPILPALSLTFGSRWVIEDHWVISLEMGFKTAYF
ncbi:MAG: hypothetical protein KC561_14310, partial [Myxococcales bacterium]|nr:hypothetical protein [Myxococcales bacterium]